MSSNKYKGLKINYQIEGSKIIYMDKYKTIEDFINTSFPKSSNPLSPKNNTVICNVLWDMKHLKVKDNVTVGELQNILESISINELTITRPSPAKRKQIKTRSLERKATYSVEDVYDLVKDVMFLPVKDKKISQVELDGDFIKGNSQRYQTFFTKGTKCVCCGIEGKFFAKEKYHKDKRYHLNLYALDANGNEILMTKDHIIPVSKGGLNDISNYQTMCEPCNVAKGNIL